VERYGLSAPQYEQGDDPCESKNQSWTGPKGGRIVEYGAGSSAELKIEGERSGGEWVVVK
jgi:hypothetical protein